MEKMNSPKRSFYIALGIGALFLAVIIFQQASNFTSQGFILQVNKAREMKDLQFKNDPDSPIPLAQKPTFDGLKYYPPKEKFRVEAALEKTAKVDTLRLLTTDGDYQKFLNAGKLVFELEEQVFSLTAFEYLNKEEPTLFVPFTDETTGEFTYGGGRYMDIPLEDELVVDFNGAYNPYCVYSPDFSCPIPPRENHLEIRILAGEVDYK